MEDNIVKEVEELEHRVFSPKPGGIVDTWEKEQARKKAADAERLNADEPVEESTYKAVKVTPLSPEIIRAQTINLQAGDTGQVLPLSAYRSRAIISVVTVGGSVILAQDKGAAISGNGFLLPYGIAPLEIKARAQLWAFNSSGAVVQVSVLSEIYAPEQ